MAQEQNATTAEADLVQRGGDSVNGDDLEADSRKHVVAEARQLSIRTNRQDGSVALVHAYIGCHAESSVARHEAGVFISLTSH
jgi:hypothetical protein